MNKNVNMEIAKMKSLMERMTKPLTNFQAMLNEEKYINEAQSIQRVEYNDIIEMLWDSKFQGAKFVGLGYVIKPDIPKKIFPSEENSAKMDALAPTSDPELMGKIQNYKTNPKWEKIMAGKSKSSSFLGEELNIIAIATYNIQWQNGSKFGKWYGDRMKGEQDILNRWGVNPMEYDMNKEENKERQNSRVFYSGQFKNGEQPIFGGRIGAFKNGEIARYNDNTEKLALKHVATFIKRGQTHYYYQKDDGTYVEITKDIVHFLAYKLGGKKAKEVLQQVNAQAQSYEEELKRYKAETSKLIQTFLLRQIGYLSATIKDTTTGEKIPAAYVNPNVDPSESSKGFSVNGQALYPILQKLAKTAVEETSAQLDAEEN